MLKYPKYHVLINTAIAELPQTNDFDFKDQIDVPALVTDIYC